jgi:O-antigen/teichoic acid export membrane protein
MSIKSKFLPVFLNTGATALCSLLILVVASRFLSVESYGIYRQFYLVSELAAPILGLGLAQSIYRFFSVYYKKGLLLNSIGAVAVACVAFWLIFINPAKPILFELISDANLYGLEYLALSYIFLNIALPILMAFYVDSNVLKKYALYNFLHVVISAAVVSAAAIVYGSLELMLYLRVAVMAIFFFASFYFCFSVIKNDVAERRIGLIALCTFSVPVGVASMVGVLSQHIDKTIVSYFETAAVYAVYANGAIELPLISIVTGALGTASLVQMSKLCNEGKMDDALFCFRQISLISSLVLFPAFIFFFINAEHFMVMLFGSEFSDSSAPFRVYLCLLPIRIVFYGTALVALGYNKVIMVRSLIELSVNVLLSVLLYSRFGTIGVAVATVITVYIWSVPFNLYKIAGGFGVGVTRTLPFKQLGFRFLIALVCAPLGYLPAMLVGELSPIFLLAINGAAYIVFILVLYQIFGLFDFKATRAIKGLIK